VDTNRNPNRRNRKPPPESGLDYVPWVPAHLRRLALRMYAAGWHDAMSARDARPGARIARGPGGRPVAGRGPGRRRGAGTVSPGAPQAQVFPAEAPPDVLYGVEEWVDVSESPPEADVSVAEEFVEDWSPNAEADGSWSDDDEFSIAEEEETVVVEEEPAPVQEAVASPKPRRTTRGARPKSATGRKSAGTSTSSARAGGSLSSSGSPSSGGGARAGAGRAAKKTSSPQKKSSRSVRTRKPR
jgi:hypothetical protein